MSQEINTSNFIKRIEKLIEQIDPTLYRSIAKYPPLSSEEEKQLFIQYGKEKNKKRKEQIRNLIINHNLRLVYKLAQKIGSRIENVQGAFQEGLFGLNKAIDKFDVKRGFRFSTYAYNWIKDSIDKFILKELKQRKEKEPEDVRDIVSKIDKFIAKKSSPEEELLNKIQVKKMLATLPRKEAQLIHLKWIKGLTLTEVGKKLGLTAEGVRQMEIRILQKLRERFKHV